MYTRCVRLGFVFAALLALPAAAGDQAKPTKVAALENGSSLGVAYTISFWGIPFGHTDFDSKFKQEAYNTTSHFETSGIVSAFWNAKIEASSSGQVAPHGLAPTVYDSFYQRGADKKERVKVTFTVQVLPSVTLPMQVLPLARVKSRFGAPRVSAFGVPSVPLAVTVKFKVRVSLHGAGVEARDVQLDASSLEDAFVRLTGTHLHQEGEQS